MSIENMQKIAKILVVALALLYLISPFDLMPGVAIDDILFLVSAVFGAKRIGAGKACECDSVKRFSHINTDSDESKARIVSNSSMRRIAAGFWSY